MNTRPIRADHHSLLEQNNKLFFIMISLLDQ
jgi:hypothetical protein